MKFRTLFEKEEWVLYNITDPKNMVRGLDKPYKNRRDAARQIPRDDEDWKVVLKKDYLNLNESNRDLKGLKNTKDIRNEITKLKNKMIKASDRDALELKGQIEWLEKQLKGNF